MNVNKVVVAISVGVKTIKTTDSTVGGGVGGKSNYPSMEDSTNNPLNLQSTFTPHQAVRNVNKVKKSIVDEHDDSGRAQGDESGNDRKSSSSDGSDRH